MKRIGVLSGYFFSSRKASAVLLVLFLCQFAFLNAAIDVAAQNKSGDGVANNSSGKVGDPISAGSGGFEKSMDLLSLGGPMGLNFSLHYGSYFRQLVYFDGNGNGLPFRFWYSPYAVLEYHDDDPDIGPFATVQVGEGDVISFKEEGGIWVPAESGDFGETENVYPYRWRLAETSGFFYLMDPLEQKVYMFRKIVAPGDAPGLARIERIESRNDGAVAFSYAEADDFQPSGIEDSLGRFLDLSYSDVGGNKALVSVADRQGRHVAFSHEAAGADNADSWTLRSTTDPEGGETVFRYATAGLFPVFHTDLIAEIQRPEGNVPYAQSYEVATLDGESYARVVSQTDAYGKKTTLSYGADAQIVTETRPDGGTVLWEHFDERGLPRKITDPYGNSTVFARTEANRIASITDRLGGVTTYSYHEKTGKLASVVDPLGNTTAVSFSGTEQSFSHPDDGQSATFVFYDLVRADYPDGSSETRVFDDFGNVLSETDRRGRTWKYTCNGFGQPLTVVPPDETGEFRTGYNADGTVGTRTDSDKGVTTYEYDDYKRLVKATRPDGTTFEYDYDMNDRLTGIVDERGGETVFVYDANGNLVSTTNPAGETTEFGYDEMDRVVSVTDPAGGVATISYEFSTRLSSVVDPNGNGAAIEYDLLGRVVRIVDPAGNAWSYEYDAEDRLIGTTTPAGGEYATARDAIGRPTRATDPLGNASARAWTPMHLPESSTDRMGRATGFVYDDAGFLETLTRTGRNPVEYERDDFGLIESLVDSGGGEWNWTRTALGRATDFADPLGRTTSFSYDLRGRQTGAVFSDGGTGTYTYDGAGNLTRRAFGDGTALNYSYDAASRLASAGGISFQYDERGALVETDYGDSKFASTYDPGGRLKTVSYDGLFEVSYTYDSRDLPVKVQDDLSDSWATFAYDADRRLTSIARSNGTTTTFLYDAAGRITGIKDGELAEQSYVLDASGDPTQAALSLPLLPAPPVEATTFAYDAAGQTTGDGYGFDPRGRRTSAPGAAYSWDDASRMTSAIRDGKTVSYSYDDFGYPLTRESDGVATAWHRHFAIDTAPVLAETEGEAYKRFYVWDPYGRLVYCIDADGSDVRFHHFDRMGNTVFLTARDGLISDAYAYTPYGSATGRIGSSDQPFTFAGRFGVRWDGETGLYAMGVRHYDPASQSFLSRDPFWGGFDYRDNLNPYSYADSNPLRYIDPTGLNYIKPSDQGASCLTSRSSPSNNYDSVAKLVEKLNNAADSGDGGASVSQVTEIKPDKAYGDCHSRSGCGNSYYGNLPVFQNSARSSGSDISMGDVVNAATTAYKVYAAANTIYQTATGAANPAIVIAKGAVAWIDVAHHVYVESTEGTGASSVRKSVTTTAAQWVQEKIKGSSGYYPTDSYPADTSGIDYVPPSARERKK